MYECQSLVPLLGISLLGVICLVISLHWNLWTKRSILEIHSSTLHLRQLQVAQQVPHGVQQRVDTVPQVGPLPSPSNSTISALRKVWLKWVRRIEVWKNTSEKHPASDIKLVQLEASYLRALGSSNAVDCLSGAS